MVSIVDEFIGKRFKAKRESIGMSVESLADVLNVGVDTIKAYEHGQLRIGASVLCTVCGVFDVRPSYFFDRCETSDARSADPQPSRQGKVIAFPRSGSRQ